MSIIQTIASFIVVIATALGFGPAAPSDVTVPATAVQITQNNDEAIEGRWYASDVWESATISFSQELADNEVRVFYSPDCNSGSGVGVWEGEQFVLNEIVSTDMACTPPERELSAWLNPIVTGGAELYLDESTEILYFNSEEGTAAFARELVIEQPSSSLSS